MQIGNSFPLFFENDEYNKYLGLYQKWICGDKNQKIEKIFSFSAFQIYDKKYGCISADYQKYAEYLYLTATSIIDNYTDYYIRIYMDESVINPLNPDALIWKDKLNKILLLPRIQIICVKFPRYYDEEINFHKELLAVMFRYLILYDANTSIILFRDVDNIYTEQHKYFTNKWLELGTDLCFYMNDKYRRRQICDLSPDGLILEEKSYPIILSGTWNIKKQMGTAFEISTWQKMFAFIEDYTDFTYNPAYKDYKDYGKRFIYGFDELTLTRVLLPIFIESGLTFYTIPVKIYNSDFLINMFENPLLTKFIKNLSDEKTIQKIKYTVVHNYWDLSSPNSGQAQYILCILSNIYFGIITGQSKYYKNEKFISDIKVKIMPNTMLMAIGLFTFKNYIKYNWYPIDGKSSCGSDVVKRFLATNKKITFEEWTMGAVFDSLPTVIQSINDINLKKYNI
jgi:hypothetical protein